MLNFLSTISECGVTANIPVLGELFLKIASGCGVTANIPVLGTGDFEFESRHPDGALNQKHVMLLRKFFNKNLGDSGFESRHSNKHRHFENFLA